MKIAVNTRLLIENKIEGIGRFTFETMQRICRNHPEHEFYFLFDRPFHQKFIFESNVTPIVLGLPTRHPLLYLLWMEWSVPRVLKKIKADLFISTDGFLSLGTKTLQLAVIHDLSFEHRPQDIPKSYSLYYKFFMPRFAKKAKRICTVSNYSCQDIIKRYKVNEDKIDVVYSGPIESFKPISVEEQGIFRNTFTNNAPFFIFVGSLHPRKNIKSLLLAFDKFRSNYQGEFKLMIVGEKRWWTTETKLTYENMHYSDDVIFTGRVSQDHVIKATASAYTSVFISHFEGFGLPIVEAYRTHIPVITSNTSSMPEVAKDAAILVDPTDIEQISLAMNNIATDQELYQIMKDKAIANKNHFSWDQTADLLWQSVLKIVN